jgi:general secretion pathway protein C
VAVLIASFFLAKITSVYIAKNLEVKKSIAMFKPAEVANPIIAPVALEDYDEIIKRNIFDSSETEVVATEKEGESVTEYQVTGEAVQTTLGIKVLGVLVIGEGKDSRSSATVTGSGKNTEVDVYAVGTIDGFAPNTKLVQVKPDRIEFVNNNRLEYALLEDATGLSIFSPPSIHEGAGGTDEDAPAKKEEKEVLVASNEKGKYTIDQTEIDNAMQNMDQLFTQIRAVPNFKDGKVSGMRILSVQPGSIFAKLGLKRGDVLERINGLELDVKKGFEIFNQLKDQKSLTLDLLRSGQKQTMEYAVQ